MNGVKVSENPEDLPLWGITFHVLIYILKNLQKIAQDMKLRNLDCEELQRVIDHSLRYEMVMLKGKENQILKKIFERWLFNYKYRRFAYHIKHFIKKPKKSG